MASAELRLAHVDIVADPSRWPGVMTKLADQVAAVEAADLPNDILTLVGDRPAAAWQLALGGGRIASRLGRARLVERAVDLTRYDALIVRYQGAFDPSWLLAVPDLPPIVAECHTDQRRELRAAAGRGVWRTGSYLVERLAGPAFLHRCAGVIAVTDELRCAIARRGRIARAVTIGNGVRVEAISHTGVRAWRSGPLELVFVCGAFEPWQGLDLLLRAIAAQRVPIRLHLIGEPGSAYRALLAAWRAPPGTSVVVHGVLGRGDCDQVFRQAHLGVSCLALHRKGMTQACPLKAREYLARGLPYVAAYRDPDVPADLPGVLQIPCGEPLDLGLALVDHVSSLATSDLGALSQHLRHHAECHVDWRIKMRRTCAFARACLRGSL
jgi:hypothetical protein